MFAWDTAAAHEALQTMDAAVFVLTADPPVSAAERDLYTKVAGLSVATFTVLNKADRLDEAGLAEAAEFTGQVLAKASAGPGSSAGRAPGTGSTPCRRRPRSTAATRGSTHSPPPSRVPGRQAGHGPVRVSGRPGTPIAAPLDEVALTRRAAELAAGDAADRVTRFAAAAEVTVVAGTP